MVFCSTCKVTVNGEEKYTAPAKSKDAGIDETLEFILGRKEIHGHDDLTVNIEVWDYRLINHFKVNETAHAVLLMFNSHQKSACWFHVHCTAEAYMSECCTFHICLFEEMSDLLYHPAVFLCGQK